MAGKDSKLPEMFQIKGYKYRAKMLMVGAGILIILIIILSMIIHGISSAVKGAGKKNDGKDSDVSSISSAVDSDADSSSDLVSKPPDPASSAAAGSQTVTAKPEKFDADGKLVIDTDTLDGKKAIAITFDDGPSEYTAGLIEGLNERGAHATFFMVGSQVAEYPNVLPLMVDGGHQLGNHTYNHTDIASASAQIFKDEVARTDDAIYNACGQRSTAFRPPYGSYTDELARSMTKTFTLWSLDTLDWKSRDAKSVKKIITQQAKDGSIVLLHDLYDTSVDGALAAIDELQKQGYVFVTVDELMTRYGYPVNPGAHSAQYAVYETNSPHAAEYKRDAVKDSEKDAVSTAAGSFYFDRQTDTDS